MLWWYFDNYLLQVANNIFFNLLFLVTTGYTDHYSQTECFFVNQPPKPPPPPPPQLIEEA